MRMCALNFKYWNVFSRFVGCFDCVFEVHSVAVILCFDLCSLAIGWKFTLELKKRTSRKSLVWWNMKYFQFDKFHEFVLEGLETSYCYHFSFWIHLLSTIDSWDFSDMWRLEGTSEDRFSIYYHVKTLSRKRFGKNQTNTDYTVAEVGVAWQWCCLEGYGFSEMGHVPLGHMYWDIYASTSQKNSSFVAICTHTGYLEVKAVPSVSKL